MFHKKAFDFFTLDDIRVSGTLNPKSFAIFSCSILFFAKKRYLGWFIHWALLISLQKPVKVSSNSLSAKRKSCSWITEFSSGGKGRLK